MTWSARVTKADGSIPEGDYCACQKCRHAQHNSNLPANVYTPCNVQKMASNIGSILTSIDTGADGHMASGAAELKCNGFDPIEPQNTEAAHP